MFPKIWGVSSKFTCHLSVFSLVFTASILVWFRASGMVPYSITIVQELYLLAAILLIPLAKLIQVRTSWIELIEFFSSWICSTKIESNSSVNRY